MNIVSRVRAWEIVKAHTYTPTFFGSVLQSEIEAADSTPKLADSSSDFVTGARLPVFGIFNNYVPIQSADSYRPTIAVGGWQICLVGISL